MDPHWSLHLYSLPNFIVTSRNTASCDQIKPSFQLINKKGANLSFFNGKHILLAFPLIKHWFEINFHSVESTSMSKFHVKTNSQFENLKVTVPLCICNQNKSPCSSSADAPHCMCFEMFASFSCDCLMCDLSISPHLS